MQIKKMIVSAFIAVMALSAAALAQGNNNPAVYNGPVKAVTNVTILPDLEAKIEAFEDAACTKPIANNGQIFQTLAWVRLTIKNKGAVPSGSFIYKGMIDVDGNKVYNPDPAQMSLAANQSKQIGVIKVLLGGTTDVVTAKLLADIGDGVKETSNSNNIANFKFTSQTAH